MKQKDLPQRWQEKLKNYFTESNSKYDEDLKEVAVFTEHCDYHIFYLPEILLELVDRQGNIIETSDYRTE